MSLPVFSVDRTMLKTYFYGIIEFRNRSKSDEQGVLDVEREAANMANEFERGIMEYSEKLLDSILDKLD